MATDASERDIWVRAINGARNMLNALRDTDMSSRGRTTTTGEDNMIELGFTAAGRATAIEEPDVVTVWDRGQGVPEELDMIAAAIAHEYGVTFSEAVEGGVEAIVDAADRSVAATETAELLSLPPFPYLTVTRTI